MVIATAYAGKAYNYASSSRQISRIKTIETQGGGTTFTPLAQPTVVQELDFLFQATQFVGIGDTGEARVYANTAPSTIDEETNATVKAYQTFDDVGGSGNAGASGFPGYYYVPMSDAEGKDGRYHVNPKYHAWSSSIHPQVTHTKQFMAGHSFKLNVPGTNADDRKTIMWYDPHTDFAVSTSFSVSIWVYPTDMSQIAAEPYRFLLWRYIDASNYYTLVIDPLTDFRPLWIVNEAGVTTKIRPAAGVGLNLNSWNNICVTYNPATNASILYLNGTSSTATTTAALTVPYTADFNIWLGGIWQSENKRFSGYMDNFVFWTAKILTSTEVTNMWTRGTIV